VRIVIDTNKVFSAILNSNSKISKIILKPKSKFNFYAPAFLLEELENHREKIKKISGFNDIELDKCVQIITRRIRFIKVILLPKEVLIQSAKLTEGVDIDDTEFIALTDHIKGRFWSGDKNLIKGLKKKGWDKFIFDEDLT
jgi:predicted nucleic acid-binding protein